MQNNYMKMLKMLLLLIFAVGCVQSKIRKYFTILFRKINFKSALWKFAICHAISFLSFIPYFDATQK